MSGGRVKKHAVLRRFFGPLVPPAVGQQLGRALHKQNEAAGPEGQRGGACNQTQRVADEGGEKHQRQQQRQQKQNAIASQKAHLAGLVQRLHLQLRFGVDRRWIFLRIAKHLHLEPGAHRLPPGLPAKIEKPLLLLRGLGVKLVCLWEIAHREMQLLRLDFAVCP